MPDEREHAAALPPEPEPRTHRRQVKPIRLQERDLDLLRSLSVARYLTVHAIEWLHYTDWEGTRNGVVVKGGWRERYKAYLERRKADPSAVYYPAPKLYHRLAALRAGPAPLVHRIARTVEQASVVYGRLPDAYALAEAGAELLCARRGDALDELWYEDPRRRSIKNLEHSVAIGTFAAALRAALEFAGQQLTDWQGDHLLASRDPVTGGSSYDRLAVAGLRAEQPLLPDGTFTLGGARYFVEIDMGTTNLKSWSEKVRAYEVYRRHPKLQARYATTDFTVLVVAPTEARLRRIVTEVVKVTRQASSDYLFLTEDRVHPTTIRPSWKRIQAFAWARRKVVDRLVELPVDLTLTGHPLWHNPQRT